PLGAAGDRPDDPVALVEQGSGHAPRARRLPSKLAGRLATKFTDWPPTSQAPCGGPCATVQAMSSSDSRDRRVGDATMGRIDDLAGGWSVKGPAGAGKDAATEPIERADLEEILAEAATRGEKEKASPAAGPGAPARQVEGSRARRPSPPPPPKARGSRPSAPPPPPPGRKAR